MAERPKTYKKKQTDGEKLVKLAKERYKRARDSQSDENSRFKANMQFTYLPDSQWPDTIKKQRELDGRPCLSVNRMPVFVRSIVNNYKQNTSGVKVLPADDGADKKTAEILTGLIRNIETQSNASQIKGQALGYAVAGNKGFYRVLTEYTEGTFEQEIKLAPIVNTLSVTYDCDDTSLDGSGWKWAFVEDLLSKEEFESKYPDEDVDGWPTEMQDGWTQDNCEKIRICEYFYKEMEPVTLCLLENGDTVREDDLQEGMQVVDTRQSEQPVVRWCILGGSAKEPLEKKEWAGKYIPIIPIWGDQQWIDGKRRLFSAMEYSQDAQRMLNFWRSTETELLSLQNKAPYMLTPTEVEGHESQWTGANATNSPYLLFNADPQAGGRPQRAGFPSPPSGVLQGAANAAQDIMDTSGIQEAGLGMQSNETSGRAINARAAQGDKASFQFLDNAIHADRYCGVILVDLIPRIIDTPRVVRTLGYDGTEQMKKVNQEVIEKDDYGQEINKIYDLSVGKYDVVASSAPSFASLRAEGQQVIADMVQGNPNLMMQAGDIIMKTMDMPYADEMSERLKKFLPEGIAEKSEEEGPTMPPEIAQQMEQMQMQMQQMDAMLQQQAAQLADKQAELQIKQAELQIKQFDAETKRIQAIQPATPPVQVEAQIEPELSEGDKLEIDVAKSIRLAEMQQEHAKEMEILRARLKGMESNNLQTVGDDGEPMESEISVAIRTMMEGQERLSAAFGELSAIQAAPKEIIKDNEGRPIGIRPVL